MAKPTITDEVQVLRFFETGPIDKVEVLFNVVSEKMRERLRGANQPPAQSGSPRKPNAAGKQTTAGAESSEQGPPA